MRALGFYSSVEPTFVFLVKKMFPCGEDPYKYTYLAGFFPYRDFID